MFIKVYKYFCFMIFKNETNCEFARNSAFREMSFIFNKIYGTADVTGISV